MAYGTYRGRLRMMVAAAVASATILAASAASPEKSRITTNLLVNGSFEWATDGKPTPPGWWFFTSKMGVFQPVTNAAHEGERCLRMRAQDIARGSSGLIQVIPVEAKRLYTFSAWVQRYEEDELRGTAYGQLVIEWKDAEDREIKRTWGRSWPKNIGRKGWELVEIERAQAPPGAVQGAFGIHLFEGNSGGKGSLLVDDAVVTAP